MPARMLPPPWMPRGGWALRSGTSRSPPISAWRRLTAIPSLQSAAEAAASGGPGGGRKLLRRRARCTWEDTLSPRRLLGGNVPCVGAHRHVTCPLLLADVLDPPPRGGRGVRGLSPPLRSNLEPLDPTVRATAASSRTRQYGATAAGRTPTRSRWGSPALVLGARRAQGRNSTSGAFAADFTLPRPRRSAGRQSPSPRSARMPDRLRLHLPRAALGARALDRRIGLRTQSTTLPSTLEGDRARPTVRSRLPPGWTRYGGGCVSERLPEWSGDGLLANPRPQAVHLLLVLGRARRKNIVSTVMGMPIVTGTTSATYPTGAHLGAGAWPHGTPSLQMSMADPAAPHFTLRDLATRVSRPLGGRSAQ